MNFDLTDAQLDKIAEVINQIGDLFAEAFKDDPAQAELIFTAVCTVTGVYTKTLMQKAGMPVTDCEKAGVVASRATREMLLPVLALSSVLHQFKGPTDA